MKLYIKALIVLIIAVIVRWFYLRLTTLPPYVHVWTEPGWEDVAATYKNNIEQNLDRGSSFAVYYKGKLVVELYGGYTDVEHRRKWSAHNVAQFMSVVKSLAALCVAILVDRGQLDYDKPVSHYWTNFGQKGKASITVSQLMAHSAGLVGGFSEATKVTLEDIVDRPEVVAEMFELLEPQWPIGQKQGYHILSFGLLIDQLIRHADKPHGRNIQQFFSDEVAKPNGLQLFIGLPRHEFHRLARMYHPRLGGILTALSNFDFDHAKLLWNLFYGQCKLTKSGMNIVENYTDAYLHSYNPDLAEIPFASANGFGSAKELARLYSSFVTPDGILPDSNASRLLSDATRQTFLEPPTSSSFDQLILRNVSRNRGLFFKKSPVSFQMEDSTLVGHPGAGGQFAWADLKYQMSMAFVTNHMHPWLDWSNPIHESLYRATYKSVKNLLRT